jgi:cell division protein FtsQ
MFWRRKTASRNRRREPSAWQLRLPQIKWRRVLPAGAALLGVLVLVLGVRTALDQPVNRVSISGRFQRVQPLDVENAVRGSVGKHGLASVDLERISRAVQTIPWVDRASVARSWPKGLSVNVVEQVPVARWGAGGLLNTRGEMFVQDLRHAPTELPELIGPVGFEVQMTERYKAAQPRLAEAGLRIAKLSLDERGAWELALVNGVVLRLGRTRVDERFDRFIAAAAAIVTSRAGEISYVDMRYASGFAIGWRSGGEVQRG